MPSISSIGAGGAQASIGQSTANANINSAFAEALLETQHSKLYVDYGSNMNPLSDFVTHNDTQFGGFIQMFGLNMATAHYANSPSKIRDVNPAVLEAPSVVAEIVRKERSAKFLLSIDESEVIKINSSPAEEAAFIEANVANLYKSNSYDEYFHLGGILLEAVTARVFNVELIDDPASTTAAFKTIAKSLNVAASKMLLPTANYNPYGRIIATDSVDNLRFITTPDNQFEINAWLSDRYHKTLVDMGVQTSMVTEDIFSERWIYATTHTVTPTDFTVQPDGTRFLDPFTFAVNDIIPAGSYAMPGADGAVPVISQADAERFVGALVDERSFGLRDRIPAALYPERSNRGLVSNIWLHVRQWAYATGLVNSLAFYTKLDPSVVLKEAAGTFVDGTDERTIVFDGTTVGKVGDYIKFTIGGKEVVGSVVVVNGATSYATVAIGLNK